MNARLNVLQSTLVVLSASLLAPVRALADVADPALFEEPGPSGLVLLAPVVIVAVVAAVLIVRRGRR